MYSPKYTPKLLLKKLVSIKDGLGSLPPEDISLEYIFECNGLNSILEHKQALTELEILGYIKISRDEKDNFMKIEVQDEKWDSNKKIDPEPAYVRSEQRRFTVFIDYKNLEDSLNNSEKLLDLSWLFNPVLEKGIIIFGAVFFPQQLNTRPAINQLTQRYGFFAIQCPRQFEGNISKDADKVDARMSSLGRMMIEHSDCTDIVIVSGDWDFSELVTYAIWHNKQAHVFSTPAALSNGFRQIKDSRLQVNLINP